MFFSICDDDGTTCAGGNLGGLDLSPILAFLVLNLIDMLVIRNLAVMTGMLQGLSMAI